MFNSYSAVQTFWSDTTLMDKYCLEISHFLYLFYLYLCNFSLRGGDATGRATPGAQEATIDGRMVSMGNSTHYLSSDSSAASWIARTLGATHAPLELQEPTENQSPTEMHSFVNLHHIEVVFGI